MMRLPLVLALSLMLVDFVRAECTWNYFDQGPSAASNWDDDYCDGVRNTPINIDTHDTTYVNDWDPLRFLMWEEHPRTMDIVNNGHTAQVTMTTDDCKPMPSVVGGNLQDEYEFWQFHIHWGSEGSYGGSEHTIDHKNFTAEIHFVTFNKKYGNSPGQAIANGGGAFDTLAVFGAFFTVGKYNRDYDNILNAFEYITMPDTSTYVKKTPLRKLLPRNLDKFWRYYGGLTTPDCNEIVVWTLFKEPIEISYSQLKKMWTLQGCVADNNVGPLLNTYRYTQARNGRKIYSADLSYKLGHSCRGWAPKYDFYWRETRKEHDFENAAQVCTKYKGTPFAGLMPVGKLRHFKNYYKYNMSISHYDDEMTEFCEGRYFRVNGIKDEYGVWREFPSGSPVIFTHFPQFQQDHGDEGDTLIWDAHLNRLYIDNRHDHYHALCYREYQRECQTCPGFNYGRECCDAGDCNKCAINECSCDQGFKGRQCEIPPISDKDIVLIGGETNSVEKTNTISEGHCEAANYCDDANCNWIVSTFAFDPHRLLACGGSSPTLDSISTTCKFLDCQSSPNQWIEFEELPEGFAASAETVIKKKAKDKYWWVTGGISEATPDTSATMSTYLLDETLHWMRGPNLKEIGRWEHCMVQIDDCKVAVIGGFSGLDSSGASMQVPADQFIHIFDTEEYKWENGPELTGDYASYSWDFTACSKVIDAKTQDTIVVIGCFQSADKSTSEGMLLWNTATNKLTQSSDYHDWYDCPGATPNTYATGMMEQINDQWIAFSAVQGQAEVWTFNLVDGWNTDYMMTSTPHGVGDMAITTRGFATGNTCPASGGP